MSIQQIEASGDNFLDPNLKYLTVHASSLRGRGNISCYNANSQKKDLPIVILLHGVYGNHWVWMNLGGAHQVYNELAQSKEIDEMLLVMPEDGSYYAGSGYLPLNNGQDFDKWVIEDVLETVIKSVDCVSESSNIYLSGLSMGGYGALRLGAKHTDKIAGISAHSSITCIDDFKHFIKEDLSIYQCDDPNEADLMHWFEKHKEDLPPLRLDCGTEDVLYQSNLALVEKLKASGIPHSFETPTGGHEWSYWNQHLTSTLRFFDNLEHR